MIAERCKHPPSDEELIRHPTEEFVKALVLYSKKMAWQEVD